MSGSAWAISMAVLYLVLVFTIAILTFRKGHWVLGLIGFIFPILWLIGALAGPPTPLKARAPSCGKLAGPNGGSAVP